MKKIGIIGLGGRISGVWNLVKRQAPDFIISAVCDVKPEEVIREQLKSLGEQESNTVIYRDAEDMLKNAGLDGVLIGTRCSLHSKYAQLVLKYSIPLYLEKPIATNLADLIALRDAGVGHEDRVVVSFPLRMTPLVQRAKEIIDAGIVGVPQHLYAWNNPNYADVYYQDWYRDENETQGLWLQKATHDLDYINYLLGMKPVLLCAMTAKRVFKGDKPKGLRCVDCNDWDTCKQGPKHKFLYAGELAEMPKKGEFEKFPKYCSFAEDTGNEDSGTAIIEYETGMHASYTQCFFARKEAGNRGCRIIGYDGTLEFDWAKEELKLYYHHKPQVDTIKINADPATHGGGDDILAGSFIDVVNGGKSCSDLSAGILSVLMCLCAKKSSINKSFEKIEF